MDQITDNGFLGMIPTKNTWFGKQFGSDWEDIQKQIRDSSGQPLELVVSIVEDDELKGAGFIGVTTATAKDWKEKGIKHLLVPMKDFSEVCDVNRLGEALVHIENCKGAFLIHCKAGRSRSALVFALHLIGSKSYTIEDAILLIRRKRPQIDLDTEKVYRIFFNLQKPSPSSSIDVSSLNIVECVNIV